MPKPFKRGRKLYAKIKNVDGDWCQVPTGFEVGQELEAQRWIDRQIDEIDRVVRAKGGAAGPLTVALYAQTWLGRRTNATAKDDRARIEKHVLPRIGHLLITAVRPRHLRDLIVELKTAGELAPKTILTISGLVHTMFNSAVIEEIIVTNPVEYERGVLPKKLDKDPTWRRQAIYTRAEIEQLLSDDRVPIDRRVLYALKFFTGRHSEVSGLTWEQYDAAASPLGALALDKTKTDVPRLIPVHPTLAKVLASWKLSTWEDLYGHKPRPVDLIVPTRKLGRRSANESQRQLLYDLERIGLRTKAGKARNRRGHDLRRTLISLARTDGANDAVLKVITHGPTTAAILDLYSSFPWETLCAEFGKLRIELLEGKVIAMVANDPHGNRGADWCSTSKTVAIPGLDAVYERPRRDSNPRIVSLGDARRQLNQRVAAAGSPPDSADLHQAAPSPQQSRTVCDLGLSLMRATADGDGR